MLELIICARSPVQWATGLNTILRNCLNMQHFFFKVGIVCVYTILSDIKNGNKVNFNVKYENCTCNKSIQQPIKMQVLYKSAKHQFGQCCRGSKLGHGYVPGNHRRDDIDGSKKIRYTIFHISP